MPMYAALPCHSLGSILVMKTRIHGFRNKIIMSSGTSLSIACPYNLFVLVMLVFSSKCFTTTWMLLHDYLCATEPESCWLKEKKVLIEVTTVNFLGLLIFPFKWHQIKIDAEPNMCIDQQNILIQTIVEMSIHHSHWSSYNKRWFFRFDFEWSRI